MPIESRTIAVYSGGIPHLAKNERDVGHPMLRGQDGVLVRTEFPVAKTEF
jgi:hypothetical protein